MPPESAEPLEETAAEIPRTKPHFTLRLDSSALCVRTALDSVRAALTELARSPDAAGSIELVLAEVLNNISEHAYRGMGTGRIELSIWCDAETLIFTTRDTGVPMPGGRAPAGRAVEVNCPLEDIPEGGYGWYLIRTLTSGLSYARIGKSNQLTFRMRRDARPLEA